VFGAILARARHHGFARRQDEKGDSALAFLDDHGARLVVALMRHAVELFSEAELSDEALAAAPLDRLVDPHELALIRLLAGWPRIIESAAEAHEPHRVAFFLQEIAAEFHLLWTKGKDDATLRFLVAADADLTRARLALVRAVALVIASGLAVFGVEPVEEM